METRSCIAKVMRDIHKYGPDKCILVEEMDIIHNKMACGSLCEYSLFVKEDAERKRDSNKCSSIYPSTLGELLYSDESPFRMIRIYADSALQVRIDPKSIMNQDMIKVLAEAEETFADYSDELKKILHVDNKPVSYYLEAAAKQCRIAGVVDIYNCCEQDVAIFGENYKCDVICKDVGSGKQMVVDWLIQSQLRDVDSVSLEPYEFFQTKSLGELREILNRQKEGEFEEVAHARILDMPDRWRNE